MTKKLAMTFKATRFAGCPMVPVSARPGGGEGMGPGGACLAAPLPPPQPSRLAGLRASCARVRPPHRRRRCAAPAQGRPPRGSKSSSRSSLNSRNPSPATTPPRSSSRWTTASPSRARSPAARHSCAPHSLLPALRRGGPSQRAREHTAAAAQAKGP